MLLSSRGFFANHSKCHALIALVGPGPEAWGCCRPILCPCPPFGSVSCGLSEEGLRWKYSHCSVGCGWDDFPQKGTVGKQMTCPWRLSISFPFLPFLSPERAVWRSWPEWQPCSDFCSSPQCHVHSEDCRHHQRGSRAFQWPSENVHPCTRWEPGSLSADRMSVPTMYRWREWPVGWVSGLRMKQSPKEILAMMKIVLSYKDITHFTDHWYLWAFPLPLLLMVVLSYEEHEPFRNTNLTWPVELCFNDVYTTERWRGSMANLNSL